MTNTNETKLTQIGTPRCDCNCWDEERDFCIDCAHDGRWDCRCSACVEQTRRDEEGQAKADGDRQMTEHMNMNSQQLALIEEIREVNQLEGRGLPSFLLTATEKRCASALVRRGVLTATESLEDSRCRDYWIA